MKLNTLNFCGKIEPKNDFRNLLNLNNFKDKIIRKITIIH